MISVLIDLAIKSTALLAAGTLIVLMMRRASASSRHLVWAGVLCAIALLPFSRLSLPALNVPVLASEVPAQTAQPLSLPAPTREVQLSTAPVGLNENLNVVQPTALPSSRIVVSFTDVVLAIWALGVSALVLRAAAGYVILRRLTSRATAVGDSSVLAILRRAADQFRVRRRIALLSHDDDGLPCTFGVVRPVILLPTFLLAADADGDSRLRAVLIHETAHIARLDAISERITQVAVMMFWFNPLVWLAARQARFERERAADDAVLAGGAKASDYASDLLAIARTQSRAMWSSAVPMAVSALERRVRAILDDGIRRGRHSRASVAVTLIVLGAALPVSAVRLVARTTPLPTAPLSAQTSSLAPKGADVAPPSSKAGQSDPLAVWNAERDRNLRQVLRRARAAHEEALTKVAIRTIAPTDVAVLETTVAQLEAAVKNFTPSTTPLTPQGLKSRRGGLAAVLGNLESSERRFTNGLLTTTDLANALMLAASVIEPSIQAPRPTSMTSARHMSSFFMVRPDADAAQVPPASQKPASQKIDQADPLAAWNAERLGMLKQVLERAQAAWGNQLKKAQIGTAAPIDVVPLETTVAQIEQIVFAFTPSTTLPAPEQIQALRAQFANALRNLDAAQVRFDNGLLTARDLANALMAAKAPATGTFDAAASMFTTTNFPGSTEKDRNSAKALYDLLTGRISSITGTNMATASQGELFLTDSALIDALMNAVNITSEVDRADALVTLAQKFALTPLMVAEYVKCANSIKDKTQRDRVFAQPIRVKSPDGKSQAYYWQRRP